MDKILLHLWYDKEAAEAVKLYTGIFPNSKINGSLVMKDTPSGDAELLDFTLCGKEFQAISGGPFFKFNPAVSLMVKCTSKEEVNAIWEGLLPEGNIFMPLDEYPFSERYGWLEDRYGLSWQIMYTGDPVATIVPNLLFSSQVNGKAEEAMAYYQEIFKDSKQVVISHYEPGTASSPTARVNYGEFVLEGFTITVMDNAMEADFGFNEAASIVVKCKDQQEIDYYWNLLSADPEAEQCGWLKDRYGLSWQIVPDFLDQVMFEGSDEDVQRLTQILLPMKKLDYQALLQASKA